MDCYEEAARLLAALEEALHSNKPTEEIAARLGRTVSKAHELSARCNALHRQLRAAANGAGQDSAELVERLIGMLKSLIHRTEEVEAKLKAKISQTIPALDREVRRRSMHKAYRVARQG